MALVKETLKAALVSVFGSFPSTPDDAAQKMADAYQSYATSAMAAAATPTFTGGEKTQLRDMILMAIFDVSSGSPERIANAWTSGVTNFWTAPPVNFVGSPGPGMVTAFPGAAALYSALVSVFSNIGNTVDAAADGIATALDTATKTVTVTLNPPPPAPPLVVTLT